MVKQLERLFSEKRENSLFLFIIKQTSVLFILEKSIYLQKGSQIYIWEPFSW